MPPQPPDDGQANPRSFWQQFNFTRSLFDQQSVPSPALLQRDVLQDLQGAASSILDAAATKASDAVDNVQSAVSSVATALPQLEDHVPLNCSFGITQFCVGFRHSLSCSGWPLTLSALLPDELEDLPAPLEDAIQAGIQELSPLPGSLGNLPEIVIGSLIAGAVSMPLLLVLSCFVAFGWPSCIAKITQKLSTNTQILLHFGVGLVCCLPYVVLVAVQRKVMAAVEKLPAWVQAKAGEVFGLSVGVLVCAVVFAVLAAVLSGWHCSQSSREVGESRNWYHLGAVTQTTAGRRVG